ncbi:hypothetical protein V5799_021803 [Amblyomma americanum]|uniref:Uncharacterized protein n=1 Tax=Amblyomma americanum TaxID=6943 RepID=A0AAQ4FPP6_AMBAM
MTVPQESVRESQIRDAGSFILPSGKRQRCNRRSAESRLGTRAGADTIPALVRRSSEPPIRSACSAIQDQQHREAWSRRIRHCMKSHIKREPLAAAPRRFLRGKPVFPAGKVHGHSEPLRIGHIEGAGGA